MTNRDVELGHVVTFHDGRGQQEHTFGQLSGQCHAQHVPVKHRPGNETFLTASVLAHNLLHELQMRTEPKTRTTNASRSPLWAFLHPQTWRNRWLHRAGRLTRPSGRLTLTISGDDESETIFWQMLDKLESERPAA